MPLGIPRYRYVGKCQAGTSPRTSEGKAAPAFASLTSHAELRRALELDADHVAAPTTLLLRRNVCGTLGHTGMLEFIKPDEFWLTA